MDFEKLCQQVNQLSPNIRFSAVIDSNGSLLFGGYVPNVEQFYDESQITKKMMLVSIRDNSRYEDTKIVGKVKCTFAEYEKIKRFSVNLVDGNLLVVSIDVSEDTGKFLENLKTMTKEYSN